VAADPDLAASAAPAARAGRRRRRRLPAARRLQRRQRRDQPNAKDKRGDKLDQDCKGGPAPFTVVSRQIGAISATYPAGYMTLETMTVGSVRKGDRAASPARAAAAASSP